jgi:hypothetical protein
MKKKVLIIGSVVVVAAVTVLLITRPFSKKNTGVTFETVKVERGNITNTVTATGTIEAVTSVDVYPVSGVLISICISMISRRANAGNDRKKTAYRRQSRATLDQVSGHLTSGSHVQPVESLT